jgi:C1A family cysteine protease
MEDYKFGWTPDVPDFRDHMYALEYVTAENLPTSVDLRKDCPDVYNQGALGSCTANAIGACFDFIHKKTKNNFIYPSRLFIYYNERAMEGSIKTDSGAMIRDGIKSVVNLGTCTEKTWPYIISKFTKKPTVKSYREAKKYQALEYKRLDNTNVNELKKCLADNLPFVFGISVYNSFYRANSNGNVPMPVQSDNLLGGHALLCVGYNDDKKVFIVRNSWGESWGDKGYCYIPYDYLTDPNLGDDFWAIKTTE